jgi:hypothetical protein
MMEKQTNMSYLRWQFRDCHKSLSFWGFVTVISAVVMLVAGCPAPWPFYVLSAGIAMTFIDATLAWYRFSRAVYQMEQNRIIRELKNENKSVDR